jgi:type I restriction enzyme S subunit
VRFDGALAAFVYYWTLTTDYRSQIAARCVGASSSMQNLSMSDFREVAIALPPYGEQDVIVGFLAEQTAKVDALIAKQEQLIATMREDRNAQLVDLVAHGCSSASPLKSSGLGWVDGVPRHWDVVNIRRVALMKTGHTPSRSVAEYWQDTTIPWFTLADVWQLRDGLRTYLGETRDRISELGLANSAADLLPAGTVVLSRTASVGFSGIMPNPMATSQDFWNWVCGPRLLPEYLMYTFRAMQSYFAALMMGSTHQTIYQPDAAAIRIPLPPLAEQQEIVRQIGCKTATIDALITKAGQVIETLREYRTALITDAVTGKIDVQETVA